MTSSGKKAMKTARPQNGGERDSGGAEKPRKSWKCGSVQDGGPRDRGGTVEEAWELGDALVSAMAVAAHDNGRLGSRPSNFGPRLAHRS